MARIFSILKKLKRILERTGYKNLAAGFVFFMALGLAGWLVFQPAIPNLTADKKIVVDNNPAVDPLSGLKNPLNSGNVSGDKQSASPNSQPADSNSLASNFTEQFLQAVQKKSFAQAQGANVDLSGAKFDLGLIDSLDDSQIKIFADNSKAAKKKYLQTVSDISVKDRGSFNKNVIYIIDAAYHNLDPYPAKEAALIYKNMAADFLAVSVPNDWRAFHKQLIIYASNVSAIYSGMADYQNDPFKGYMAFEKIKELITGTHSFDIANAIIEKSKEVQ